MRIGIGIPTQNRCAMLLDALRAHLEFSLGAILAIADDGSEDETRQVVHELIGEAPCAVFSSWREKRGVAAAKNECLRLLLNLGCDHLLLMEDDVRPVRAHWLEVMLATAQASRLEHLLYLPAPMYGVIHEREGVRPTNVYWKGQAGGMVMYFTKEILAACGLFDEGFGRYGYEHNELSSRLLVHLGSSPVIYPHVAELEHGKYLWSQDHESRVKKREWAPTCLQDGVQMNSEQSLRLRQKYGVRNQALYERLMKVHKDAWKQCRNRRPFRV